jgi:hypothetical protein
MQQHEELKKHWWPSHELQQHDEHQQWASTQRKLATMRTNNSVVLQLFTNEYDENQQHDEY